MNSPAFIPAQIKGAYCLQAFCHQYDIRHEAVNQLIEHLLSIAKAENLTAWEQAGQMLPLNGRGDPWPADLDDAIPAPVRDDFHLLVDATVEIGLTDFYGMQTSRPLEFYETCKRVLMKHRVPAPQQVPDLMNSPSPRTSDGRF